MTDKRTEILIAEDDMGHAALVRKNMLRHGITNDVRHFADGQQVLDFVFGSSGDGIEEGRRYLLLLDIRMPKVDGVDVLRRIRSKKGPEELPVIMMTTMDDPMEIDKCHMLGCQRYFPKPVDFQKLAEDIREIISIEQ